MCIVKIVISKCLLVQRFKEREMKSTRGMPSRLRTWNDSYMLNETYETMFYSAVSNLLSVTSLVTPLVMVRLLIDWLAGPGRSWESKKLIWLPGMWRTAWSHQTHAAATLLLARPGINFLWRNMKILSLTWQALSHPCRSRCKRLSCIILNQTQQFSPRPKISWDSEGAISLIITGHQPEEPRHASVRDWPRVQIGFIWGHGHGTFLNLLSIDMGVFSGSRKTKPGLWCVTGQT